MNGSLQRETRTTIWNLYNVSQEVHDRIALIPNACSLRTAAGTAQIQSANIGSTGDGTSVELAAGKEAAPLTRRMGKKDNRGGPRRASGSVGGASSLITEAGARANVVPEREIRGH